ncbi:hypothetical protein MLD38_005397 [Melastoma candidum]|uniref:Uncharacterized protein n=1 Tax=Melastoma candidum TaxID=119954 RepID=A0ACB9RNP8_9MYRT|nr:hypothetical protein MLD38_005397 [Melastoma candidum]
MVPTIMHKETPPMAVGEKAFYRGMAPTLGMSRNNESAIPDSFKDFQSLVYLSISNSSITDLSSSLGTLQQCKNLKDLVLTLNFFDEELLADPILHFLKLMAFIIANGRLRGSFPQWLQGCADLQLLDLSWNRLSGTLPHGEIPKSLTGLTGMIDRNLSLEEPAPDFPLFVKRNSSTRGLRYNQIQSLLPILDLGFNNLTGEIWLDFGNLKTLHVLDLKNSSLSGPIPDSLSGMTSLESLDLSVRHNTCVIGEFLYGTKLAIKKLLGDCGQMEREFQAEVEILSRAQHPNLVHLQGYCLDKETRMLIYSYMENGNLDYWLHEKPDGPALLDWTTRLRIARGADTGLAYLHQSCEPHILHRDIKSGNILLDENFEAHLADFGLARLISRPHQHQPRWDAQMKKLNGEDEVFDRCIYGKKHDRETLRVFDIACACSSDNPKSRPSSQQLGSWLEGVDADLE